MQRAKDAAKTNLSLPLTLSARERGQRSAAMVDLKVIGSAPNALISADWKSAIQQVGNLRYRWSIWGLVPTNRQGAKDY